MTGSTVVVGVDDRGGSGRATEWAAERALLDAGRLVLLHVTACDVPGARNGTVEEVVSPRVDLAVQTTLQQLRTRHRPVAVSVRQIVGDPADVLSAVGPGGDLLVVGMPEQGAFRWRRSTTYRLMTSTDRPLVVVPPAEPKPGPVVVGVDGSEESYAAVRFAEREARLREVPLVAVHCWSAPGGGYSFIDPIDDELNALLLLDRVVKESASRPADVSLLPLCGPAAERLRACSEQARLLVVGRPHPHRWLRSVPEALLRSRVRCPVAMVS